MNDEIICPNCHKTIPLTDAIAREIDEKYKSQIEELKSKNEDERQKLIDLSKKRIQEEREKAIKESEESLKSKLKAEMELEIKNTQNEASELKTQKQKLQDQLLELNRMMRRLEDANKEKELEMEKRFREGQEKVREVEQKRVEEQYHMKMLEQEKKLTDAIKANEDLRRKLEQGSQQMQGEVYELAIEEMLTKEFPHDEIREVPKGVNGADIIQIVKNRSGQTCGTIIWEMKRTKNWSNQWIPKLKSDMRQVKADLAILVSEVTPEDVSHFGLIDGVWVCHFDFISGLAYALRAQLLEVAHIKSSQKGQEGKMAMLYEYVISNEFKHRVLAIREAFTNMQDEIEKERRWFALKWAREEKNLRSVLDTTFGMQGELESIVGKSLPQLEPAEPAQDALFDEKSV
ncbi:DUF2130 domain-containing protein [Candidatus Woesebacteria bacterium]|nr:DUF2130 domain-containing protein [Candidatus Woesebacteria bacterium]